MTYNGSTEVHGRIKTDQKWTFGGYSSRFCTCHRGIAPLFFNSLVFGF